MFDCVNFTKSFRKSGNGFVRNAENAEIAKKALTKTLYCAILCIVNSNGAVDDERYVRSAFFYCKKMYVTKFHASIIYNRRNFL